MAASIHKAKAVLPANTFATTIQIGDFSLTSDMPPESGESTTGPTPMEYLEAALAGCVAMTIRMYVNRKNWDIGTVNVEVEKQTKEDGQVQLIKTIHIEKEVSADQLKRIQHIAKMCPVSKILDNGVEQIAIFKQG